MSLKSEVEELVDWLSGLMDEEAASPTPDEVSIEVWRKVTSDLHRASGVFEQAEAALRTKPETAEPPLPKRAGVLAELARDLARESEDLSRRADVLADRTPEPDEDAVEGAIDTGTKEQHEDPHDEESKKRATANKPKHGTQSGGPVVHKSKPHPLELARKRLGSVQGTVETARGRLEELGTPGDVAASFAEELDVLAEMALGLRRRLDDI